MSDERKKSEPQSHKAERDRIEKGSQDVPPAAPDGSPATEASESRKSEVGRRDDPAIQGDEGGEGYRNSDEAPPDAAGDVERGPARGTDLLH